jgi:CHRD domain-containing protein
MQHVRTIALLAAMFAFVTLNTSALADEKHQAKLLEGVQETPAVITGASGSFDMDIAKGDGSFDFELTYGSIEGGSVTQAHIHVGQPNVAGGIVIFLCTNLTPPAGVPVPPACPSSGGTVTGTRTAADVLAQTTQGVSAAELSAVLTAIRDGVAYANVHSTASPAGEIRGQIK